MTEIKAHFDGRVFVPDEPVNLPVNQPLHLLVAAAGGSPMMALLKTLDAMPDNPSAPADLAAQHDHYLHGLPKRS